MGRWVFSTGHAQVLLRAADDPGARNDISATLGTDNLEELTGVHPSRVRR
ncbi:MAG TPA: hypothetical protein VGD68_10470 [Streptosporangiaceae bacterium]